MRHALTAVALGAALCVASCKSDEGAGVTPGPATGTPTPGATDPTPTPTPSTPPTPTPTPTVVSSPTASPTAVPTPTPAVPCEGPAAGTCRADEQCLEGLCRYAPVDGLWAMNSFRLERPTKLADIFNPWLAEQLSEAELITIMRTDAMESTNRMRVRAGNGWDLDYDGLYGFDRRYPRGVNRFIVTLRRPTFQTDPPITYHFFVFPGTSEPLEIVLSQASVVGYFSDDLRWVEGSVFGTVKQSIARSLPLPEGGTLFDLLDLLQADPDVTICEIGPDGNEVCEPAYSFKANFTGFKAAFVEAEGPFLPDDPDDPDDPADGGTTDGGGAGEGPDEARDGGM